jgi:twinkle protein
MDDRGINQEITEYFGVRTSISETNGEPDYRYFPYYKEGVLQGFKRKSLKDKRDQTFIGNGKDAELFGQQLVKGTKFVIITEGEEDTMAAKQIMRETGKNYNVVSLPNGANIKGLQKNYHFLYEFTQITVAFDNDEPGKKASSAAAKIFDPGQLKVAEFKEFKDTNDYLRAGDSKSWWNCIYNATARKPDGIVTISDIWEEATRRPEWGLPWPWPSLTQVTYGRRGGEIYGVGAGTGVGKSEFFKELVDQVIQRDGLPIGCAFLEEPAAQSAKRIAGKVANKKFFIPDADYSQDELETSLRSLDNKLWLYDHNGYKDWDSIKSYFKYLARSVGVKDFILDNLTAVVAQEENEYSALNAIMEEMASLAIELDARIYYASHLRKAAQKPHEEGGRVQLMEFKGSGAMGNWSNFIFGIERDTQNPVFSQRNTSVLRVLKDRYTGLSNGFTVELWYDHDTSVYREKTEEDGVELDY